MRDLDDESVDARVARGLRVIAQTTSYVADNLRDTDYYPPLAAHAQQSAMPVFVVPEDDTDMPAEQPAQAPADTAAPAAPETPEPASH